MENNAPKKIGLALSGASTRSIFYVGFLEALEQHGIKIDYIAATSGASIAAAAYSAGTLGLLKRHVLRLNKRLLLGMIPLKPGSGGLCSMEILEEWFDELFAGKTFQDVHTRVGFLTTDLHTGEQVVLSQGKLCWAVRGSCSLPGIFEPLQWGRKQLVDGGLVNAIPADVAKREGGVDYVIGVDLWSTPNVFHPYIFKAYQFLRKLGFSKSVQKHAELGLPFTNPLDSLLQALHIAEHSVQRKVSSANHAELDVLIKPELPLPVSWKHHLYLHLTDFSQSKELYEFGKQVAKAYIPVFQALQNNLALPTTVTLPGEQTKVEYRITEFGNQRF